MLIGALAVLALAFFLAPTMLIGADYVPPNGFVGPGAGVCGGPGFMGQGGFGAGYGLSWQVADILGMDANEVIKQFQAGKSYAEIAQEKGISKAQLEEKLLATHKARLDQYVTAGTLTPQQAKFMQDNMALRIKSMLDYKYTANNTWGFRGRRGFGGCGRGFGSGIAPGVNNTTMMR